MENVQVQMSVYTGPAEAGLTASFFRKKGSECNFKISEQIMCSEFYDLEMRIERMEECDKRGRVSFSGSAKFSGLGKIVKDQEGKLRKGDPVSCEIRVQIHEYEFEFGAKDVGDRIGIAVLWIPKDIAEKVMIRKI